MTAASAAGMVRFTTRGSKGRMKKEDARMQKITSFAFALFFGIAAFGSMSPAARATVILNVDVNGQLLGAQGVDLGSLGIFDVEFKDGTCIFLFTGCDNAVDDFPFTTRDDAVAAVTALLAQVLVNGPSGAFDDDPTLTNGCSNPILCLSIVPYLLETPNDAASIGTGNFCPKNTTGCNFDTPDFRGTTITFDTSVGQFASEFNFAVFTRTGANNASSVPEPASLALFGLGLLGLAGIRRRQRG